MNNKLRPALIGGAVMGFLSGVPYLNLGNIICCMWIVGGGMLASYLYIKKSPQPVNVGEGAMIGAMAGVIGTFISLIISVPLTILMGYPEQRMLVDLMERLNPQQADVYRERLEAVMSQPVATQFFSSIFSIGTLIALAIIVLFALIGGLLAVPLFEKRKNGGGSAPPPPPQFYGGTPGGNYAPPPPPPPGSYGPSEV
jgi:hypothetical protein